MRKPRVVLREEQEDWNLIFRRLLEFIRAAGSTRRKECQSAHGLYWFLQVAPIDNVIMEKA